MSVANDRWKATGQRSDLMESIAMLTRGHKATVATIGWAVACRRGDMQFFRRTPALMAVRFRPGQLHTHQQRRVRKRKRSEDAQQERQTYEP